MPSSQNPRVDPHCDECPGDLVYREQVRTPGGPKSRFECNNCGKEVLQK